MSLARYAAAAVLVVAAAAGGLFLLGGRGEERERRLDDRRVEALEAIGRAVDLYWTRNGRLPDGLREIPAEAADREAFTDPVSGQPYAYRVVDDRTYELCGTFDRDATNGNRGSGSFWSHGAGRHCFQVKAREVTR
jgi:hypothetical protein